MNNFLSNYNVNKRLYGLCKGKRALLINGFLVRTYWLKVPNPNFFFSLDVQNPITLPPIVIAFIAIGCVAVLILGIVLAWRVRVYNKKYRELTAAELLMFENGDPNAINPDLAVDDQADLLPYNKNFEFPVEKLKFNKQLG